MFKGQALYNIFSSLSDSHNESLTDTSIVNYKMKSMFRIFAGATSVAVYGIKRSNELITLLK